MAEPAVPTAPDTTPPAAVNPPEDPPPPAAESDDVWDPSPQENAFIDVAESLYASIWQLIQMNAEHVSGLAKKIDPMALSDMEDGFEQGFALCRLLRVAQETVN
jgi:hypothetical protein